MAKKKLERTQNKRTESPGWQTLSRQEAIAAGLTAADLRTLFGIKTPTGTRYYRRHVALALFEKKKASRKKAQQKEIEANARKGTEVNPRRKR